MGVSKDSFYIVFCGTPAVLLVLFFGCMLFLWSDAELELVTGVVPDLLLAIAALVTTVWHSRHLWRAHPINLFSNDSVRCLSFHVAPLATLAAVGRLVVAVLVAGRISNGDKSTNAGLALASSVVWWLTLLLATLPQEPAKAEHNTAQVVCRLLAALFVGVAPITLLWSAGTVLSDDPLRPLRVLVLTVCAFAHLLLASTLALCGTAHMFIDQTRRTSSGWQLAQQPTTSRRPVLEPTATTFGATLALAPTLLLLVCAPPWRVPTRFAAASIAAALSLCTAVASYTGNDDCGGGGGGDDGGGGGGGGDDGGGGGGGGLRSSPSMNKPRDDRGPDDNDFNRHDDNDSAPSDAGDSVNNRQSSAQSDLRPWPGFFHTALVGLLFLLCVLGTCAVMAFRPPAVSDLSTMMQAALALSLAAVCFLALGSGGTPSQRQTTLPLQLCAALQLLALLGADSMAFGVASDARLAAAGALLLLLLATSVDCGAHAWSLAPWHTPNKTA